jgi:hypothetical protein
MLKMILFLFYIKEIYSIGPIDSYEQNDVSQQKVVNLIDICPCDITEGVCDRGCCCDPDCLQSMLDNSYYEDNKYCDPKSYASRRINSKLDYCDDFTKSLNDLYNPLVLAFKILKKGFCLYADHFHKADDKTEQYEKKKNEIQNQEEQTEDFSEVIRNIEDIENINFNSGDINAFQLMNFNAPIALPSGLCLFNAYPIKKYEDYEVICSYNRRNSGKITNIFSTENNYNYLIQNNNNNYASTTETNNIIIKKIEIIYSNHNGDHRINRYYENTRNDYDYQDLTFIVKFLNSIENYKKSGNPGYIKGKPLLIGIKEGNTKQKKFKNDAVFPIEYNNNNLNNENIYYNNYFDNKITFEDFIIYGYNRENNNLKNYISQMFSQNYLLGKNGDANIAYKNDWIQIGFTSEINPYLLMGIYKTFGTVNNAQFQIHQFDLDNQARLVDNDQPYYYFITKFLKLKKIKTKWWYALRPGFFKLPRNTMYPFRVGTTTYEDK